MSVLLGFYIAIWSDAPAAAGTFIVTLTEIRVCYGYCHGGGGIYGGWRVNIRVDTYVSLG